MIVKVVNEVGVWVIYYLIDYVFFGNGDMLWLEMDVIVLLNVYGEIKLVGEKVL